MYQYDIFISYASKDSEWAQKIYQSLSARGLTVFLDQERLKGGEKWEEQLKTALNSSKNMIGLWSANARNSDWATKEMAFFDVDTQRDRKRKLLTVVLNDDPKAYSSLQALLHIKKNNLYEGGVANVPQHIWEMLVEKIISDLNDDDDSIPIRRVIVTLTRDKAEAIDVNKELPVFGPSLSRMLTDSQKSRDQLLAQYGDTLEDWKPFGGSRSIVTVMDEYLNDINRRGPPNYKWLPVDESQLLTDMDKLNALTEELKKQPAIVVVDPVAFFSEDIRARFSTLLECIENKDLLVMAFSYFELLPQYSAWRKLIEHGSRSFHQRYFDPPIPKKDYRALLTVNPLDPQDAGRFIKSMIAEMGANSVTSNNHFTH